MDFSNLPFDVKEYQITEYQSFEDLYLSRNVNREFRERFQKALTKEVEKDQDFVFLFQRDDPILMGLVIEETTEHYSRRLSKKSPEQNSQPVELVSRVSKEEIADILENFAWTASYYGATKIMKYLLSTELRICNCLARYGNNFIDDYEVIPIILRKLQEDPNRQRTVVEYLREILQEEEAIEAPLVKELVELLVREDLATVEFLQNLGKSGCRVKKIYKILFVQDKIRPEHVQWMFDNIEYLENWEFLQDYIFPVFDSFQEKKLLTLPLVKYLTIWFSDIYGEELFIILEDEESRRLLSKISGYYSNIQ